MLDRWRDELPNLAGLMERGVYGPLTSVVPPITVPAWSCMMSSRTPGDLGVYGFRNRTDHSYNGLAIADSTAIKVPRLWDIATRNGKPSIVLGVPGTYPTAAAERRDGLVLPDAVDAVAVHLPADAAAPRSSARSASTSSTARTSAPTTRTTCCGRSTR